MAGILIFMPGYAGQDPGEFARLGAGDLLDSSVTPLAMPLSCGPDDNPGVLWTFDHRGGMPGDTPRRYDAATQVWFEAPTDGDLERGRYWVGYVRDARPRPEELQRERLIDGEPVTLAAGLQWVVPIESYIPRRLTRDHDTGREKLVPHAEHEKFSQWANAMFDYFMSDGFSQRLQDELVVHIPGGLKFAAAALSKNYRVNADVVDALELVGQTEAFEIARVAVGIPQWERLLAQKKSEGVPTP